MKYDDIVAELGEFGPYQKRVYYGLCLITVPSALMTMGSVFTLATPDHRCALPDLTNDTYESQGTWHDNLVKTSIPWDEDAEDYSYCKLFTEDPTTNQLTNETKDCSKWLYSDEFFKNTFISEIDMVCEDKSLRTYANMVLMGGMLTGSLVLGSLADVIGRKKVTLIGLSGTFVVSVSTAFVRSYVPFILLRFATAIFKVGFFLGPYIIGIEIVGPTKRKFAGVVFQIFWCVGLFLLALLAYLIRDWNYLQLATTITVAIAFIMAFFMPESPRWLISKGRYEDATKVIQRIAKGNGVTLSDTVMNLINVEEEEPGQKIWHMFKIPVLLVQSLVIFFNWMDASLVYYGLSLNVGALSGNIYLNFVLGGIVELAGYVFCLLLLDRSGRKPLQCFTMLVAGVACLGTMFPVMFGNDSHEWITITLSLIGKFGASSAFAIIYIFSSELFPTPMRSSGMGMSSVAARIGGIASPYIADLGNVVSGDFGVALPLIIFGGLSISAGLLALLLPETMGRTLPETVEEAKIFARKAKMNEYAFIEKPASGHTDTANTADL